jgi:hypothetical protein
MNAANGLSYFAVTVVKAGTGHALELSKHLEFSKKTGASNETAGRKVHL